MSEINSTSNVSRDIFHLQEERRLCEGRIAELERKIARAKKSRREARERREAEFNKETETNWVVVVLCLLFCLVGIVVYFIYDYFHVKEVKADLDAKCAEDQKYWDGIILGYKKELEKEKLYLEEIERKIRESVLGEG